jgi:transcriptional regulator with XRE-family HTH domain
LTVSDYRSTARALGRSVRDLRTRLGVSQEELAARAGVHRTFIGRIERGETNVTIASLIKIARGLRARLRIELQAEPPTK